MAALYQSSTSLGAPSPEMNPPGAPPPDIIIKSLNVGLTNNHIRTPYAYTFSRALVADLVEIFRDHRACGLFLCEMGSQKPGQNIDDEFRRRCGSRKTPASQWDVAFCDHSNNLLEYLQNALHAADLEFLEIHSAPPYAYIGDPQKLRVSSPSPFAALPGSETRRAVLYDVELVRSPDQPPIQFPVVCNHSPSSRNWDELSPTKKGLILQHCLDKAGAQRVNDGAQPPMWITNGEQPPMWIICGDFNTAKGPLNTYCSAYQDDNLPPEYRIMILQALNGNDNKDGDYMLVQGFSFRHVNSTIGISNQNRQHISDCHNLVTLCGRALGPLKHIPPTQHRSEQQTLEASQPPRPAKPAGPPSKSTPGTHSLPIHPTTGLQVKAPPVKAGSAQPHVKAAPAGPPPVKATPLAGLQLTSPPVGHHKPHTAWDAVEPPCAMASPNSTERRSQVDVPPLDSASEPTSAVAPPDKTEEFIDMLAKQADGEKKDPAADQLLQILHGSPEAPHGTRAVIAYTTALLDIRKTIVPMLAQVMSTQEQWKRERKTLEQWTRELERRHLSKEEMTTALRIWKEKIFQREMKTTTAERIQQALDHGDRQKARDIGRNAFRAWQKEKYGHAAIATAFLKYPHANHTDMVQHWLDYKKTSEYAEQHERCGPRKKRPPPAEAQITEINPGPTTGRGTDHFERLQQLRKWRQQAIRQLGNYNVTNSALIEWFKSGGLDKELEEMTLQHGSGTYYDNKGNPVTVRECSFTGYLERR